MRRCSSCGAEFTPTTTKGFRCPSCRRAYDAAWRAGRRAAGLPSSGTRVWDQSKRDAWRERYYARPSVRHRRAEQMRASIARHADRAQARRRVRSAIEAGRLCRRPCERCGATPVDAHHDDYSRPLDVRWLCREHHVEHHHAKAEGK